MNAFFPEPVFKNKEITIENYPTNINYSNMENNTVEVKEELMERWQH